MYTAISKLLKPADVKATDLETNVAQALFDLENSSKDLKVDLSVLRFVGAKEFDLGANKKAIVILVPVRQLKSYHRIQAKLVRELEKKFTDRTVLFVANRRIMDKPRRAHVTRPRTRTLTAVYEKMLEDIVYPVEIVGKRIRVKLDGSKHYKVFLDPKEKTNVEHKIDAFGVVYKKMTGKDTAFLFPETH